MQQEQDMSIASLSEQDRHDWLRLARTDNVGPVTFHRLVERYGTAGKALEMLPELSRKGGRKKPLTAPPAARINQELEAVDKAGGRILTAFDPDYPVSLAVLEDCPPVLTVLGNSHLLNKKCLGMVGARNASINGRKMAEKLARECGERGDVVVVSGLARGIDAAAHAGALATGTVAVVGGGADVIYPKENEKLYHAIVEQGAVVAENPLGWQPRAQDFPRRNRIISGVSLGVAVIEATMRSGSLITARLAGEQGRDVMAVPGFPGDPRAQGPNSLIKDGALLIQSAEDILENFGPGHLYQLDEKANNFFQPEISGNGPGDLNDDFRILVLENLSYTPLSVDELVRACNLSIGIVQEALLELELAGRLTRHPGNRVSLTE